MSHQGTSLLEATEIIIDNYSFQLQLLLLSHNPLVMVNKEGENSGSSFSWKMVLLRNQLRIFFFPLFILSSQSLATESK